MNRRTVIAACLGMLLGAMVSMNAADSIFGGGTGGGTFSGSIADTQVAVGSGTDEISGSSSLTFSSGVLAVTGSADAVSLSGGATGTPGIVNIDATGSDSTVTINLLPKGAQGSVHIGSPSSYLITDASSSAGTALLISGDQNPLYAGFEMFSPVTDPYFQLLSSRGTLAAPTASQTNDSLGNIAWCGRGASNWGCPSIIYSYATENYTNTAKGSKLAFYTTPTGTNGPVLALTLNQDATAEFGSTVTATGYTIGNAGALKTDTTTAHTGLIQAYDVNGTTYRTFGTLTNGDTPDFTLSAPAGGTMTLQPSTYKSADGTTGATVTTCTGFKNGLCISGT